jgi:hypothetical protein
MAFLVAAGVIVDPTLGSANKVALGDVLRLSTDALSATIPF